MKNFIAALLILVGVNATFAQDHYFSTLTDEAKATADSLTQIYSAKLGLTPKQELLFKKKAANFVMMRNEVEKKFTGKEKLQLLLEVDTQENGEMLDILTRPQFESYKMIKSDIQPLSEVKE